eukprot:TRINITY_DN5803_c0_g1_i1.p1 TRINITY_DN5803_c0_g1~~TRINITY_DN5803_c0_g1_i1.p1  ORF type:complete len:1225 (+),score=376.30 TRINITY_DN5803_c0_g1_i1:47-3721(+)
MRKATTRGRSKPKPKPSAADLREAERIKALGTKAFQARDFANAAKQYRASLHLVPKGEHSAVYALNLAAALLELGKYARSIEAGRRGIELLNKRCVPVGKDPVELARKGLARILKCAFYLRSYTELECAGALLFGELPGHPVSVREAYAVRAGAERRKWKLPVAVAHKHALFPLWRAYFSHYQRGKIDLGRFTQGAAPRSDLLSLIPLARASLNNGPRYQPILGSADVNLFSPTGAWQFSASGASSFHSLLTPTSYDSEPRELCVNTLFMGTCEDPRAIMHSIAHAAWGLSHTLGLRTDVTSYPLTEQRSGEAYLEAHDISKAEAAPPTPSDISLIMRALARHTDEHLGAEGRTLREDEASALESGRNWAASTHVCARFRVRVHQASTEGVARCVLLMYVALAQAHGEYTANKQVGLRGIHGNPLLDAIGQCDPLDTSLLPFLWCSANLCADHTDTLQEVLSDLIDASGSTSAWRRKLRAGIGKFLQVKDSRTLRKLRRVWQRWRDDLSVELGKNRRLHALFERNECLQENAPNRESLQQALSAVLADEHRTPAAAVEEWVSADESNERWGAFMAKGEKHEVYVCGDPRSKLVSFSKVLEEVRAYREAQLSAAAAGAEWREMKMPRDVLERIGAVVDKEEHTEEEQRMIRSAHPLAVLLSRRIAASYDYVVGAAAKRGEMFPTAKLFRKELKHLHDRGLSLPPDALRTSAWDINPMHHPDQLFSKEYLRPQDPPLEAGLYYYREYATAHEAQRPSTVFLDSLCNNISRSIALKARAMAWLASDKPHYADLPWEGFEEKLLPFRTSLHVTFSVGPPDQLVNLGDRECADDFERFDRVYLGECFDEYGWLNTLLLLRECIDNDPAARPNSTQFSVALPPTDSAHCESLGQEVLSALQLEEYSHVSDWFGLDIFPDSVPSDEKVSGDHSWVECLPDERVALRFTPFPPAVQKAHPDGIYGWLARLFFCALTPGSCAISSDREPIAVTMHTLVRLASVLVTDVGVPPHVIGSFFDDAIGHGYVIQRTEEGGVHGKGETTRISSTKSTVELCVLRFLHTEFAHLVPLRVPPPLSALAIRAEADLVFYARPLPVFARPLKPNQSGRDTRDLAFVLLHPEHDLVPLMARSVVNDSKLSDDEAGYDIFEALLCETGGECEFNTQHEYHLFTSVVVSDSMVEDGKQAPMVGIVLPRKFYDMRGDLRVFLVATDFSMVRDSCGPLSGFEAQHMC